MIISLDRLTGGGIKLVGGINRKDSNLGVITKKNFSFCSIDMRNENILARTFGEYIILQVNIVS